MFYIFAPYLVSLGFFIFIYSISFVFVDVLVWLVGLINGES